MSSPPNHAAAHQQPPAAERRFWSASVGRQEHLALMRRISGFSGCVAVRRCDALLERDSSSVREEHLIYHHAAIDFFVRQAKRLIIGIL